MSVIIHGEHTPLMQLAEARAENERLRNIIAETHDLERPEDCCGRPVLHAEGRKIRAERAKR